MFEIQIRNWANSRARRHTYMLKGGDIKSIFIASLENFAGVFSSADFVHSVSIVLPRNS